MNPSFSTQGSAATDTLRHSTVDGILVQLPSPSNSQPAAAAASSEQQCSRTDRGACQKGAQASWRQQMQQQ
jgi:hypothetical protein